MFSRLPPIAGLFITLATLPLRWQAGKTLGLPFAGLAILVHDVGSRRGAAPPFLFATFCALGGP